MIKLIINIIEFDYTLLFQTVIDLRQPNSVIQYWRYQEIQSYKKGKLYFAQNYSGLHTNHD